MSPPIGNRPIYWNDRGMDGEGRASLESLRLTWHRLPTTEYQRAVGL
jgi:hypothetical protein